MRTALFFALAVISIVAAGQRLNSDTIPASKWMFGAGISPDIAYRTLHYVGQGPEQEAYRQERDELESFRWGAKAGVHVNYFFSPKFALGTGVLYSVKGYRMERQELHVQAWHVNDPAIPVARSFDVDYRFLDVPLQAVIFLGKGRLRSITNLGLVYNIFLVSRHTDHYEYADGRIEHRIRPSPQRHRPFMLSGVVSTGLDYRLKDGLHLRMEPNFRHAIFTTDQPFEHKNFLWNAGVNFAVLVRL